MPGVCLCLGLSLVAEAGRYSGLAVRRFLILAASLAAERMLSDARASGVAHVLSVSCSLQVLEHRLNSRGARA